MGVCCSKKDARVLEPFVLEVQIANGDPEHGNALSAQNLILGRYERTLRARRFLPYDAHSMQKPTATTGQPWTDEAFPHVFEKDREGKTIKITWKRPKDFASDVRLFGNTIGLNRYCVKQGQVSDCFFISTLSAIAEHAEYISQIFPEDAYETDPNKYTGIVHCRFWWMGEWIDVYTDDILPCSDDWNRYVGVHSDDKNVVWAPLAEKALARLYGSYPQVKGNQSEVFRLLTGGLVGDIKISDVKKGGDYQSSDTLFQRLDKALMSGSTVLTNIPQEIEESKLKGLVSNHAYSVTGALKQIKHKKEVIKLLKIRNPWGEKEKTETYSNDGEWKGCWSYASTEWKEVEESLREQHNVHINKGGEFWVCMEDFCQLFGHVYIGDRIPNFDRDGFRKEDGLDKVINILGEWHGATSAGSEEKNKMKNPRFMLKIPGQNDTKAISVVIEITRQFENPANSQCDNDTFIGVIDLYKIEKEEVRSNRSWMSLNLQTADESHIGCRTTTYLCKLSPGDHLLVPYFYDNHVKPPASKSFCIRIFMNVDAACSQMNENPIAFYGERNHKSDYKDDATCILTLFGEWRGETAAGFKKNKMRNPKFLFNVPDIHSTGQHARVHLHLRCNRDVRKIPNADMNVFKIEKDEIVEKRLWRSMQKIRNKEEYRFQGNYVFEYELMTGNYLLLPFFYDEEYNECEFCIRILASCQVQCRPQTENPVMFVREAENSLEYGNKSYKLERIETMFGEWVKKLTAGGQISYSSFGKNPHFELSVAGNVPQPVLIALLQETVAPIHAIGCYVAKVTEGLSSRASLGSFYDGARVNTYDGKVHPFMRHTEASGYYMLSPGQYRIRVFTDKPNDEKKFALVIATQEQLIA